MAKDGAAEMTPRPDQLLGMAVEQAYTAFARHRLGPTMVVRRGDVSPAEVTALSGPIRRVTAAAIDRWLPHAVTTWGTADDLRTLLPRIFELLTAGLLATPPEVLFAKLRLAEAPGWPSGEVAALGDIIATMWVADLTQHPSSMGIPASRLLCALAELDDDIGPRLDDWRLLLHSGASEGRAALRHLHDLGRRVATLRSTGLGMADLFWSPQLAAAAELETWLAAAVAIDLPGG